MDNAILKGKKVLIVDDSQLMRGKIRRFVTAAGMEVAAEAETGLDAITKYRDHNPDIVTMDIVMPDMDGIKALNLILKIDPEAKVIMISSALTKERVLEAIRLGAKNFVVKPFKDQAFLEVIASVCKGKAPQI